MDIVDIFELRDHLNLGEDDSHDTELVVWVAGVTAHVEERVGVLDTVSAALRLAAMEDIRGLYQPGQIGTAGGLGQFGTPSEIEPLYRPVRMWPRVDAWIERSQRTARGPAGSFPDAKCWPDSVES